MRRADDISAVAIATASETDALRTTLIVIEGGVTALFSVIGMAVVGVSVVVVATSLRVLVVAADDVALSSDVVTCETKRIAPLRSSMTVCGKRFSSTARRKIELLGAAVKTSL